MPGIKGNSAYKDVADVKSSEIDLDLHVIVWDLIKNLKQVAFTAAKLRFISS